MNPHLKSIPLFLLSATLGLAEDAKLIQEFPLDEHTVYTIPVSLSRVTTINFPGPISAMDAANVTSDPKTPGQFQIAHAKGSDFFSVRALASKATTNLNVRWNKKTYVIELVESPQPLYSVIFQARSDESKLTASSEVSPHRLLALLDKARAYPFLKAYHPEAVSQIERLDHMKKPCVMDYKDYEVQIEEIFRFNPEDTLVFRLALRNKTGHVLHYPPDGFSLRVGDRTYPQSVSDASGTIPPHSETPAYFAVTGTPDGGRNDLSLKNEFTVILDCIAPKEPEKPAQEAQEPLE